MNLKLCSIGQRQIKELQVKKFFAVASILILAAIAVASAQQSGQAQMTKTEANQDSATTTPLMISLDDMKWTGLPERPGMQFALLSGNPSSGAYTQMRKVPAGTDNPLHAHTNEIKNVIVKGVWYTGPDSASAKDFGPGSIVIMPGNWVHVSGCRAGAECVFYQEGEGKFDFKPSAAKSSEMKPE
jgi:hypothetical protein